jgi:MFS family permease
LFVVYLVGAVVVPFGGHWIDERGHRAALAIGMGLGAVGAVLTLTPSLALVVAGLALLASGVFIAQATASSHIGKITHDDRGLAVGIYSSCYYAGGSVGGTLTALVWHAGGWTASVLFVIAVQALTISLAMMFWTRSAHHELAPAAN